MCELRVVEQLRLTSLKEEVWEVSFLEPRKDEVGRQRGTMLHWPARRPKGAM